MLTDLVEDSIFRRLYMRRGIIWNVIKSNQGFKDSQTHQGRLNDCYNFLGNIQLVECCFSSSKESFLLDLSKCHIIKFRQNFKKILSTYLLKYFLFPLHVTLPPLVCRESQALSAQEVLESGSFVLLLLGKVCKIVSVVIKAWLYFIRLNSSGQVVWF